MKTTPTLLLLLVLFLLHTPAQVRCRDMNLDLRSTQPARWLIGEETSPLRDGGFTLTERQRLR